MQQLQLYLAIVELPTILDGSFHCLVSSYHKHFYIARYMKGAWREPPSGGFLLFQKLIMHCMHAKWPQLHEVSLFSACIHDYHKMSQINSYSQPISLYSKPCGDFSYIASYIRLTIKSHAPELQPFTDHPSNYTHASTHGHQIQLYSQLARPRLEKEA